MFFGRLIQGKSVLHRSVSRWAIWSLKTEAFCSCVLNELQLIKERQNVYLFYQKAWVEAVMVLCLPDLYCPFTVQIAPFPATVPHQAGAWGRAGLSRQSWSTSTWELLSKTWSVCRGMGSGKGQPLGVCQWWNMGQPQQTFIIGAEQLWGSDSHDLSLSVGLEDEGQLRKL